ncbi:MAG: type-F conjugative transfer system secretin TraK [Gammaproteobacteria bacterium GWF2_41_13]|nr:MAG: type-F conjugative transfer system secretin TraK [Gammaproteobacteria bacterium GWF2_41_13]
MNKNHKNSRAKNKSCVEHKHFWNVAGSRIVFSFFIFFMFFMGIEIFSNPSFAADAISVQLTNNSQSTTKPESVIPLSPPNSAQNTPQNGSSSSKNVSAQSSTTPSVPTLGLVPVDNVQNPEVQSNPFPQPFVQSSQLSQSAQSSVENPSNSLNQNETTNPGTDATPSPAMNSAPISNMSQANKTNEKNESKSQSLHHPIIVNFADNDQFVLFFSTMDLNRLYLPNDHIVSLNGPPEAFSAHNDDAGIYVALLTSDPFTLFLSTAEGHHFSILVKPSEKVGGFTYEFHAKSAGVLVAKWEEDSPYSELIMKLMRGMINGEAPAGYGFYDISHHAPKIHFYNVGLLKPITLLKGAHLSTISYEFDNTTDTPITLSPNEFYHAGTRAVSLSQETVAAKGSAMVYVVISNEPTADSPPS